MNVETQDSDISNASRSGEKTLIQAEISNAIFWKVIGIDIIALFFFMFAPPLGFFLLFVSFLVAIYAALLKNFLMLKVTNQRIFYRSGLLKVDTVQLRLDRVESVEIQRTIMGQFLSYGTVVLTGTGSRYGYIPYVANATKVRDVIDELLFEREKKTDDR